MFSDRLDQVLRTAQKSPLSTTAGVFAVALSTLYLFRHRQLPRTSEVPPERERVLILGATSGVGRTLAHRYASRGAFVCVVGRRQPKLDEVVQECRELSERAGFADRVLGVRGDCGAVQDMVQLRERLHKVWQGLDTLIITVGVSALQPLLSVAGVDMSVPDIVGSQASPEGIRHAVNAATSAVNGNFIGPYVAAITYIPQLSYTSPSPSVLLLSSVAAVIPAPTRSLYAATKSASLLLYQALSIEHPSINFTFFLPGTIEGSFRASAVDNPPGASGTLIHEADPNEHGLKCEFVADRCIRAIDSREKTVFTPSYFRVGHLLYWIWPAFVEWKARIKYNFSRRGHSMTTPSFVVFGYGSLIFKPPPHVVSRVPGFLKGYVRRFAQKSHDHRGTPEDPGRVVTLVHREDWDRFSASDAFPHEDVVWGVAYTIDPAYVDEVRDYLDYREKDGYTMETVDVHTIEDDVEKVVIHDAYCYVGRPDNPSFVGSEPLDALAAHIWHSVGPSGKNKDYLYQLAESVRALAPASYDSHLFALETRIRQLDEDQRGEGATTA